MDQIEFIRHFIMTCPDEEAVAFARERLKKAKADLQRNNDEVEKEREELLNAILDCIVDVAKPSSIIATELNISSQKAQAYCGILEREDLVIVTIGKSPINSKRNVKYFKKA